MDFALLRRIASRLRGDDRFERVVLEPPHGPDRLTCHYRSRFYPSSVEAARLELTWYENGDFSMHYHETLAEGAFDHRWDRHPSDHNARDHVHPGPDAPTPGEDRSHPTDWRDVLSMVIDAIDRRQRAFWADR